MGMGFAPTWLRQVSPLLHMNYERHTEVRPWSDTAPSRWAALARCGRSGHVQARLDGIQVSSRLSARLLVWAVHAGRSSRWMTASLFSQPQLARRPKVPAEHVWPSCLCHGCAGNLEYTVGWTAKPGSPQCHLPTQLEDVPVSTILGTLSALEALCDYALYKSTFRLHYIYLGLSASSGLHDSYSLGGVRGSTGLVQAAWRGSFLLPRSRADGRTYKRNNNRASW